MPIASGRANRPEIIVDLARAFGFLSAEEISARRRHARLSFSRSRARPIKGMLIKIHVGALAREKRSHRLINQRLMRSLAP